MEITLTVNDSRITIDAAPTTRLVDVLRDELGLTGTKDACGRGDCGACTVLVGGRAVLACLTLAVRVTEEVRTIEGLTSDTQALRESFADNGGLQCGYCTPGLIVRCSQLTAPSPDAATARVALAGNFCRCTGYAGVVTSLLHHRGTS